MQRSFVNYLYGSLTRIRNDSTNRTLLLQFKYCSTKAIKCWKCGVERKSVYDLFCTQCNSIQKPYDKKSYFKVLNFDEKFEIDLKLLTTKYRSMQNVLHPDKFSSKPNEEKVISEDYSSLVNEAYNVLQSPLKRALHLLHLKGVQIDDDQKLDNPEFLMEIMELNEEIVEADSPEKLKELNEKNKKVMEKVAKDISDSFNRNDLPKAKENIIKLKYYASVGTHVNTILREKGIVD